ncbi:MAG: TolC family protein [Ginsengibacter sp.]
MISKSLKIFFSAVFICMVVISCKVTQTYKAPEITLGNLYRDLSATDSSNISRLSWNEIFTDYYLQNLINKGIANNLDLKMAYERVQQSRAYFLQSGAAFLPTLNANANVTTSKFSDAQNPLTNSATLYQLGFSSSWEVDIWGKLNSSRNASLASLLQTEAASHAIQSSIVAGIANYYYLLIALDQQLVITIETVKNWDITVETMKSLKTAGRITEAGVVQSEAQRYAAEVTIPDLKQRIKETENALSILIGEKPASILRGSISNQKTIDILSTGVPAQLLSNRPDVMQAEYNFRYFFEMTNVARTYFYPSLNITGSAGLSSFSIDKLFSSGAFGASLGGGLLQPILNRKENKTRLTVVESQQRESLLNFENTLLKAGMEVSDALSLYQTGIEKSLIRTNQLNALTKSVEYSQELLQNGFATYTEIITARQSLLQAELGKVNDRLQQLQAIVNLYLALGGGWR